MNCSFPAGLYTTPIRFCFSFFFLVQIKGSIIFQLQQRQCLPSRILTSNLLLRLPCFVSAPLHAWESHMLVFLALAWHTFTFSFLHLHFKPFNLLHFNLTASFLSLNLYLDIFHFLMTWNNAPPFSQLRRILKHLYSPNSPPYYWRRLPLPLQFFNTVGTLGWIIKSRHFN